MITFTPVNVNKTVFFLTNIVVFMEVPDLNDRGSNRVRRGGRGGTDRIAAEETRTTKLNF